MRSPLVWASRFKGRGLGLLLLALVLGGSVAAPAEAKVYLSRKQAIAWAFPGAEVAERTLVLSEAQARAVETHAEAPLDSRIVKLYTATREGAVVGYAVIDIHEVRTRPEALLVVMTPDGAVRSVRVLAFYEPPEYLASERWLEQFERGRLETGLDLGGAIHGIAGSTLSSRAVSAGVRRALALHRVLVVRPKGGAAAEGEK
ncbi:MAG: FMN-binding protein [Deltaproteobacteria bacterium]|nr:FMN-binding protein [Deltaproteobacteria bacterium]MBW2447568.1 FMN-binding protein [Deltaproteobacteria bacterium]